MYIISHMNVKSVFQVLEVAAELAYSVITEEALKLICANLGVYYLIISQLNNRIVLSLFISRITDTDGCFLRSLRQYKEADFNNEQNNNFLIK